MNILLYARINKDDIYLNIEEVGIKLPKVVRGIITISIMGSVISFILNALLSLLLVMNYNTLTNESIVATIEFEKIPNQPKVYIAHLYSKSGSKIGDYTIYGDQWRMDVGFIKMKYWANIFGVDSKYTLNRFEGRYQNIQDENRNKHKAYQLESHNIINIFSFLVDTQYGSSVYQNIKLNTKFIVLRSQTGLMVREKKILIEQEKSFFEISKELLRL